MFRLIGFFALVWVLASLLGHLPVLGPLFARSGCFGLWLSAMLLSWAIGHWGQRALAMRQSAGEVRRHLAVDTPHGHGKVGSLYLAQGRARKALEHLELAARGEPEVAEWHYRLGLALLKTGRLEEAYAALKACLEIDVEHGYGGAQMRLAEVLGRAEQHATALEALAIYETNHGPCPESAYRRGLAHKKLGQAEQSRAALGEVGRLAQEAARYQKKSSAQWVVKAKLVWMS